MAELLDLDALLATAGLVYGDPWNSNTAHALATGIPALVAELRATRAALYECEASFDVLTRDYAAADEERVCLRAALAQAARALCARSLAVLEPLLRLQRRGDRHLAHCRRGMWVDGYSVTNCADGAPCSKRCTETRALIADLRTFLEQQ